MNKTIVGLLALTVSFHSAHFALAGESRPNYVLIVTADHGADAACYGTVAVYTFHMDNLAQQGIRFREP